MKKITEYFANRKSNRIRVMINIGEMAGFYFFLPKIKTAGNFALSSVLL